MSRRWLRPAIVAGALGAGVAVFALLAHTTGQAAGCDTWIGANGNFSTPTSWSTGAVPTSADDACITATMLTNPPAQADVYTVLLDASFSVRSLTLGAPTGAQTLVIPASNVELDLAAASTINRNGVLTLGSTGTGYSVVCCAGATLTNYGQLNSTAVASGGASRYLRTNVSNASTGMVDLAGTTLQDSYVGSTTTTNNGTFTVEPSGSLLLIPNGNATASFVNGGGSVTNNGTFRLSTSRFTQRGGAESGNPVVITDGGTLDDDVSSSAGQFALAGGSTGSDILTGTGSSPGVAPGQVVTISSNNATRPNQVTLATNFSNAGTITLGDTGLGHCSIENAAVTLTNTGHLNTLAGGGYNRYLRVNLVNAAGGMVDIGAATLADLNATTFTNNGTLVLEPGRTFYLSAGSTFTQGAGGTFQTTVDASATKFGQLNGGGDAVAIDGTVKVITVGHPAVGSSWAIISNANRSGTFPGHDFGNWNYDVQYSATGVTLVARGTCDVWIGGVDNNFGTAANWSLGFVPTSIDDACINATTTTTPPAGADTYTVLVNGDFPVNSLTLGGPSGTQTLDIKSGSRLTLLANSSINARGVMILGDGGNGDAWLGCVPSCSPTGPTLTNTGTLKTIQGGGGIRHIQVIVINAVGATLDLAGTAVQTDAGCNNPGGVGNNRAIINNGTVTVEAAGTFSPDCGFVNNAGATVVNNGMLTPGGAFVQRGSESGNPVMFMNGSGIDDDLSAGPGTFVYSGSAGYPSGQNSLGGSGPNPGIPAGQVITIASTNTYIGIYPNIKNAGTIILGDNSGSGDSALCCSYFTAAPTITNTGTIKSVKGGGGIRHLQVNVANAAGGIIDIAADTRQDQTCGASGVNATSIINDGSVAIEATGRYAMSDCPAGGYQNTFTQRPDGTFQTTINGNTIAVGQLVGGVVNLDGRLKVTTVGSAGVGYLWRIIDGSQLAGQFPTVVADNPYTVRYSATGVALFIDPCGLQQPPWSCQPTINPPAATPGGPWWKRP